MLRRLNAAIDAKHPAHSQQSVNTVFPHLRSKSALNSTNFPGGPLAFWPPARKPPETGCCLPTAPPPHSRLSPGAPTFHGLGPGAWAQQCHCQQQTGPQLCQHLLTGGPHKSAGQTGRDLRVWAGEREVRLKGLRVNGAVNNSSASRISKLIPRCVLHSTLR